MPARDSTKTLNGQQMESIGRVSPAQQQSARVTAAQWAAGTDEPENNLREVLAALGLLEVS